MDAIRDTFLSRLLHQYRHSPNIIELMDIISLCMQDTVNVCDFILSHNSIDTAEGDQLLIFGELLGVEKPLKQEDRDNLFTLRVAGEYDDPDNSTGFLEIYELVGESAVWFAIGGHLVTQRGLNEIDKITQDQENSPAVYTGEYISDAEYRKLIRQKAASYRKTMTRENLFVYLNAFGARCNIDDDTAYNVVINPFTYYDLNEWQKWYVIRRGFRPAGIQIKFSENLENGDSI